MKVMHFEFGRTLVGGPQQVIYIVNGLSRRGVDCVVAAESDTPLARNFADAGIRLRHVSCRGDWDLWLARRIRDLILEEAPDIVHLHSRRGAILGSVAARWAGVPSVLSRRVDNMPKGKLSPWAYGALNERVICISEAIRDVLLKAGVREDRLVTIRSAVDTGPWGEPAPREEFLREFGLPPDALTIGVVAQLILRKGHRFLFEALQGDIPDRLRVIVFGEGKDRAEVEAALARSGLGHIVQMAGHRYDMPRWMGNLDLVVHPATLEGLGVALLQASSAGVPIVASAAGGIGEAVRDGVNGVLVPPEDVTALRAAILSLLADEPRRRALGRCGPVLMAGEFSTDAMVEQHLALYESVLAAAS